MPRSLAALLLYAVIAIKFYATPKEENQSREAIWENRLIASMLAAVILSCVPWFISDITESRARWPELLHDAVLFSALLSGYLLVRRKK